HAGIAAPGFAAVAGARNSVVDYSADPAAYSVAQESACPLAARRGRRVAEPADVRWDLPAGSGLSGDSLAAASPAQERLDLREGHHRGKEHSGDWSDPAACSA